MIFSGFLNFIKHDQRFASSVLLLLLSQTVNASGPDTTKPLLKAIEVKENSDLLGESFYRIFHVGTFIVYQSQYQFDSSANLVKFDQAGNLESTKPVSQFSEKRSRFFVFHQDSIFGYSYDPHEFTEASKRFPVDSVLKGITGFNSFEKLHIKKPDTITWNADRTELKEVYLQKASEDTPAVRLSFYYSSSRNDLKASLNPLLDSIKKMKLYKYEYVIGEFYSKKHQTLCPEMKFTSELNEITVNRPEEILQYIRRYKRYTGAKVD